MPLITLLGVSGAEAKTLWEKLRHSFRDALRRQQKCIKSGAAAETIKPWKFQKQMGFLQPYMANKEREGNLQEGASDNITQNSEDDVVHADVEEQSQEHNILAQSESIHEAQSQVPHTISPSTSTAIQKTPKRLKKDNVASILKQSMEKSEKRAQIRSNERKQLFEHCVRSQDPLYHFFMSMYETAKRMPPPLQLEVRKRVFTAVADVEATLLNMPMSTTPQQHWYSSTSNQSFCTPSTPAQSPYSDSSSSYTSSRLERDLSPATNSSGVNLINFINEFTE